jgi:hypothetical protein
MAREYVERLGNQMHPMIQTLFPNNDAVFQDDSAPIHTAGSKNIKVNLASSLVSTVSTFQQH